MFCRKIREVKKVSFRSATFPALTSMRQGTRLSPKTLLEDKHRWKETEQNPWHGVPLSLTRTISKPIEAPLPTEEVQPTQIFPMKPQKD